VVMDRQGHPLAAIEQQHAADDAEDEAAQHRADRVAQRDAEALQPKIEVGVDRAEVPFVAHQKRSGRKGARSTVVGWPVASSAISLPVMPAMVRPRWSWPKAKKTLAWRGERPLTGLESG